MSGAPGVSAPSVADIQLGPGLGARGSVTATGGYQPAAPSISPQERAAASLTGRTPPAQPNLRLDCFAATYLAAIPRPRDGYGVAIAAPAPAA